MPVLKMPVSRDPLLVPGEYNAVARASRDVEALRAAHSTPCTRREANAMLRALMAKHDLGNLIIAWSARNGRGGVRALYRRRAEAVLRWRRVISADGTAEYREVPAKRYRREYVRDEAGRIQVAPFVSLPPTPMESVDKRWGGRLRVGLVLHEFAHAYLIGKRVPGAVAMNGHGPVFTAFLDDLIAWWRSTQRAGA